MSISTKTLYTCDLCGSSSCNSENWVSFIIQDKEAASYKQRQRVDVCWRCIAEIVSQKEKDAT